MLTLLILFSSYIYYFLIAFIYLPKNNNSKSQNINKKRKGLIIIPVLNGASKLESRIKNINENCNKGEFDVLIISDGSTDNTFEVACAIKTKNSQKDQLQIIVDKNEKNIGRALTHNLSVKKYNYYFYVFSDLDTKFTKTFPKNCAEELLKNQKCMASSGQVVFESKKNYGRIFSKLFLLDVFIREMANKSKLCMKGSGPALCIKRECWEDLKAYEDIDHCAGFMAIKKGGYLSYLKNSKVIDLANETQGKDFKARRRMTRKSLLSYFNQIFNYKRFNINSFLAILGYTLHKPARFFAYPIFISFLFLYIHKNFGIILTLSLLLLFILLPQLKVIRTIFFSYIYGIYDFLSLNKKGTYTPVNQK